VEMLWLLVKNCTENYRTGKSRRSAQMPRDITTFPIWTRRAKTLAIGGLGAVLFNAIGAPLPFLFGPMAACLIAALSGVQLIGLGVVQVAMRTILGVAVGAAITPALVGQLPQMALSVVLVPVYILLIGMVGVPFFHRLCGFDRVTAWYASMPGGLQDMIVFGGEAGGDVRALSLIHATRVLVIVTTAPLVLIYGMGVELSNPIGAPAAELPLTEMAMMVVAALVGWKGAERIGLFGASILGPMLAAAAMSLTGLIHVRPPAEAIQAAQFFIGMAVGVGYVGVTGREIRRVVLAGVAFVVLLAGLAALFMQVVAMLGLAPSLEGFLAFSPGGQAEMAVLAIVTGADLGYVVLHHVARIALVITLAPLVARMFRIR
jgi:membrane AbrB-like protein